MKKKEKTRAPKRKNKIDFGDLFNNNTFVLILSIVLGILVWFTIYVDQRPNSNTFITDVPITINYENSMAKDLGLEIIGEPQYTTDVQVNGKKYKITRLKAEDFTAQVSLANVTEPGEYTLRVQVIRKQSDPEYSVISWTTTEVKLKFDKVVTKQFPIEIIAPGLSAAEGYLMETPYADIDFLTVKGPEADVNKIDRCVINIDTEDELTESFNTSGQVVLLDKNGDAIKSDQLDMDNRDLISVTIPIYKAKTLPLRVEFVNIPRGFPIDELSYTLSRNSLLIASPSETIDTLDDITIGPIDFRTIDVGSEITLDINLKAGLKNVENVESVTVKFPTYGLSSKQLEVSNFVLENVPSGYEARVLTERLRNIKVVGATGIVNDLNSDDLVGIVDLSQDAVKTGRYNVTVKIYCQGGVLAWAVGEYTVDVSVQQKSS